MNLQKSDLGYEVLDDSGRLLGEVWKVAGRSFSGAWHWSAKDGKVGVRCMTRKDAVQKILDHIQTLNREPLPSDGPEYHELHAAWLRRQ